MIDVLSNIQEIVRGIAEECKMLSQTLMRNAINDKYPSSSLGDSKLYEEMEVKNDDDGLITILVNGYIDYIQGGREPNKPFPWRLAWGEKGDGVLVKWAESRGIPADNTTIYFIWKSIIEEGIKPRPIFEIPDGLWTQPNNDEILFDLTDEYWDDWSKQIVDAATANIDEWFDEK